MNNLLDENKYDEIILIDNKEERLFVTRKPIIVKDEEDKKRLEIDRALRSADYYESPMLTDKLSVFKKVDISDWEYESYTDLLEQIANYNPHKTKKM